MSRNKWLKVKENELTGIEYPIAWPKRLKTRLLFLAVQ